METSANYMCTKGKTEYTFTFIADYECNDLFNKTSMNLQTPCSWCIG